MNRTVSTVIVRVPGFSVDEASHLRAPAPPLAGCRVLVGIGGEERLDGGGVAQLPRVHVASNHGPDRSFVSGSCGALRSNKGACRQAENKQHSHHSGSIDPLMQVRSALRAGRGF